MHFLNPMNDIVFKRVFGDEKRKNILISFLNSILVTKEGKHIVDVTLLDPYQAPHLKGTKGSYLDVSCRDESGAQYIVEMQVVKEPFYDKRVQYYASKAYSSQLKKGEDYESLNPVIFIGILNFNFSDDPNYISTHLLRNVETEEHLLKDIRFVFIELPKFSKHEEELETLDEKWVYFLKNAKHLEAMPSLIKERAIQEAFEITAEMNWTDKELDALEKHTMFMHGFVLREKEAYNKGVSKGEAIAEAKAYQDKLITIKKLASEGVPMPTLSQIFNVSMDTLRAVGV